MVANKTVLKATCELLPKLNRSCRGYHCCRTDASLELRRKAINRLARASSTKKLFYWVEGHEEKQLMQFIPDNRKPQKTPNPHEICQKYACHHVIYRVGKSQMNYSHKTAHMKAPKDTPPRVLVCYLDTINEKGNSRDTQNQPNYCILRFSKFRQQSSIPISIEPY